MATKFRKVVCDEHGIGGSGKYCGVNDAHFDRINVFYHEALGGKYVPRAVFFDLEPGVIGAVPRSRRYPALQLGQPREPYALANWNKGHYRRDEHQFC
jgi:tubulin beta